MAKTILIIEDSPFVRKVYRAALQNEGFAVVEAGDGDEGLQAAVQHHPALILLDLVLPRLGGMGVLEKLKNTPTTYDIPVVVLTGMDREDLGKQALELGAKDYILKTQSNPEEMAAKIKLLV